MSVFTLGNAQGGRLLALTFAKKGSPQRSAKAEPLLPTKHLFFTGRDSVLVSQDPGVLGRQGFGTTAGARLSLGN